MESWPARSLRAAEAPLNVDRVELQAGDTIEFVVDILQELQSDQFLSAPDDSDNSRY